MRRLDLKQLFGSRQQRCHTHFVSLSMRPRWVASHLGSAAAIAASCRACAASAAEAPAPLRGGKGVGAANEQDWVPPS